MHLWAVVYQVAPWFHLPPDAGRPSACVHNADRGARGHARRSCPLAMRATHASDILLGDDDPGKRLGRAVCSCH